MKKVLSVYLKQYYGRMLNCQSSDESFLTYFTIILNAMINISKMFVIVSKAVASANRIAEAAFNDYQMYRAQFEQA